MFFTLFQHINGILLADLLADGSTLDYRIYFEFYNYSIINGSNYMLFTKYFAGYYHVASNVLYKCTIMYHLILLNMNL